VVWRQGPGRQLLLVVLLLLHHEHVLLLLVAAELAVVLLRHVVARLLLLLEVVVVVAAAHGCALLEVLLLVVLLLVVLLLVVVLLLLMMVLRCRRCVSGRARPAWQQLLDGRDWALDQLREAATHTTHQRGRHASACSSGAGWLAAALRRAQQCALTKHATLLLL
jgi:hypothetical protein